MDKIAFVVLSAIYFKAAPEVVYGATATISFTLVAAIISLFTSNGFDSAIMRKLPHWENSPSERRGFAPGGYFVGSITIVAITTALIYFTAIGFSTELTRKARLLRYTDLEDAIVFAAFAGAPIAAHCTWLLIRLRLSLTHID